MRSHLVHTAKAQVPNNFELIHMAARITRAFHKPGKQCVGKSINEALERIAAKGDKTFILLADERANRQSPDMGLVSQVLIAESSTAVS